MNTYPEKIYTKRRRRHSQFRPPEPQPRPKRKTVWVFAISEDGAEHCLIGKDAWARQPDLHRDIHGKPMRVVDEFEAESYEKARAIYESQL